MATNRLQVTHTYRVLKHRSGHSTKGDWEMITAHSTDEDQKNNITIWITNRPSGLGEGDHFRIDKIETVKFAWKKLDSGSWVAQIEIDAQVTKEHTELPSFDGKQSVDDLELPAEWGEDDGELPY